MFGKIGDLMGKMQEAKKMAEEIKNRLENTDITTESAGGDIKITITGTRVVKQIDIAPSLQHGDKQELQKQLLLAVNSAISKADKLNEEEMKKVTGGLMPGLF